MILYEGPSLFDDEPIVVIATGLGRSSKNTKTGKMVQTHILLQETDPNEALTSRKDGSICGACNLRGTNRETRSCYVNVGRAELSVWRAYKRNKYQRGWPDFNDSYVRIGTYGDPCAVPAALWLDLVKQAKGWTGYTHAWRSPRTLDYQPFLMASADTQAEAEEAQALGWRTFRVRLADEPLTVRPREVVCPASAEAGHKLQCMACRMCDGARYAKRPNIAIQAHGVLTSRYVRMRTSFEELIGEAK